MIFFVLLKALCGDVQLIAASKIAHGATADDPLTAGQHLSEIVEVIFVYSYLPIQHEQVEQEEDVG